MVALAVVLLFSGCVATVGVVAPTTRNEVGEFRPGHVNGYLDARTVPDSLALLPAPPVAGSALQAADEAAFRALTTLQGTPRGAIAVSDADLSFPHAPAAFSCALGVAITQQDTPNLSMLLLRTMADAALVTAAAKDKYKRVRPMVALNRPSCTPADDAASAKGGSYPSSHTSIGWAWALVLTEVAPDRADAILQRGRAFGQSRAICGVHWESDVEAGRVVGAATVAREHASPVFMAQLDAARIEVAKARSLGAPAAVGCAAEAAAIASTALLAP